RQLAGPAAFEPSRSARASPRSPARAPSGYRRVQGSETGEDPRALVRAGEPPPSDPAWRSDRARAGTHRPYRGSAACRPRARRARQRPPPREKDLLRPPEPWRPRRTRARLEHRGWPPGEAARRLARATPRRAFAGRDYEPKCD